jgi:hypothetical protein
LNFIDKMAKLIFNERDVGRVRHSPKGSHVIGHVENFLTESERSGERLP